MDPSPVQAPDFTPEDSKRIAFNAILVEILGSNNVYYQPPENRQMDYPCIVYEQDDDHVQHADNGPYKMHDRYQVTFIRHEPDSPVKRKLMGLPFSSFSRHFATSGLNHDVFVIHH
jgi:hypothetical protein